MTIGKAHDLRVLRYPNKYIFILRLNVKIWEFTPNSKYKQRLYCYIYIAEVFEGSITHWSINEFDSMSVYWEPRTNLAVYSTHFGLMSASTWSRWDNKVMAAQQYFSSVWVYLFISSHLWQTHSIQFWEFCSKTLKKSILTLSVSEGLKSDGISRGVFSVNLQAETCSHCLGSKTLTNCMISIFNTVSVNG